MIRQLQSVSGSSNLCLPAPESGGKPYPKPNGAIECVQPANFSGQPQRTHGTRRLAPGSMSSPAPHHGGSPAISPSVEQRPMRSIVAVPWEVRNTHKGEWGTVRHLLRYRGAIEFTPGGWPGVRAKAARRNNGSRHRCVQKFAPHAWRSSWASHRGSVQFPRSICPQRSSTEPRPGGE